MQIASLHVHPIKSLHAVPVQAADVHDLGLALDRRWLLVDPDGRFLTQREHPRLTLLRPTLHDATGAPTAHATLACTVRVTRPDGATRDLAPPPADAPRRRVAIWEHTVDACTYPADVDAWFTEALGMPCALVWMPDDVRRPIDHHSVGPDDRAPFSDAFPVLVATEASLADLNARLVARGEAPVPMARFRPNVVLAGDVAPYAEDGWATVETDAVALATVKPCGRCVMTTVDPETAATGREPLRTLSAYRKVGGKVLFAQNALVRRGGTVRVGDAVRVH